MKNCCVMIDETRNLLDEMKHNDLMSEMHKKTCKCLNYVERFQCCMRILASAVTGSVWISEFISSVCVPVGIASSAIGIKSYAITTGIKKCKSIIKKKKKKHSKMVLPGNIKLDTIEVLISKAFIDSFISHDEFVSVNNVLRKYNEMKEEIKNPENSVEYIISKLWKPIVLIVRKILRTKSVRKTKQNSLISLSNCAVCSKKNGLSLKIKNSIKQYSTILIVFKMISLKWIKSLTNFCYWKQV